MWLPRFQFTVRRMMVAVAVVALIVLLSDRGCQYLDDQLSPHNREMDVTLAVLARDKATGMSIDDFRVSLGPSERNILGKCSDVSRSDPSNGSATVHLNFPTLNYRWKGRPEGYAFFTDGRGELVDNGGYMLEVSSDGYETRRFPFPSYIARGRQLPPKVLPPITVDLIRDMLKPEKM